MTYQELKTHLLRALVFRRSLQSKKERHVYKSCPFVRPSDRHICDLVLTITPFVGFARNSMWNFFTRKSLSSTVQFSENRPCGSHTSRYNVNEILLLIYVFFVTNLMRFAAIFLHACPFNIYWFCKNRCSERYVVPNVVYGVFGRIFQILQPIFIKFGNEYVCQDLLCSCAFHEKRRTYIITLFWRHKWFSTPNCHSFFLDLGKFHKRYLEEILFSICEFCESRRRERFATLTVVKEITFTQLQ